jgi:hypothetical protein
VSLVSDAAIVIDQTVAPAASHLAAPGVLLSIATVCFILLALAAAAHAHAAAERMYLFLQQRIALPDQPIELCILLGKALGVARLVLGARERGGLFDELPDVVARGSDAFFEFGKRK